MDIKKLTENAIERINSMSIEELRETFIKNGYQPDHGIESTPDEKMIQAAERVLEELDKMTDQELLEALEACEDRTLSYAMFPEEFIKGLK